MRANSTTTVTTVTTPTVTLASWTVTLESGSAGALKCAAFGLYISFMGFAALGFRLLLGVCHTPFIVLFAVCVATRISSP